MCVARGGRGGRSHVGPLCSGARHALATISALFFKRRRFVARAGDGLGRVPQVGRRVAPVSQHSAERSGRRAGPAEAPAMVAAPRRVGRHGARAAHGKLGGGRRSLLLDIVQLLFPPFDCIPNQVAGVLSGKGTGVHKIGVDRRWRWCACAGGLRGHCRTVNLASFRSRFLSSSMNCQKILGLGFVAFSVFHQ